MAAFPASYKPRSQLRKLVVSFCIGMRTAGNKVVCLRLESARFREVLRIRGTYNCLSSGASIVFAARHLLFLLRTKSHHARHIPIHNAVAKYGTSALWPAHPWERP